MAHRRYSRHVPTHVIRASNRVAYGTREIYMHFKCLREVQMKIWVYKLVGISDMQWQEKFRFDKSKLNQVVNAVAWPTHRTNPFRNGYRTRADLSTTIGLRHMTTPARWCDMVYLFSKHPFQFSEIFWEDSIHFWLIAGISSKVGYRRILAHQDRRIIPVPYIVIVAWWKDVLVSST